MILDDRKEKVHDAHCAKPRQQASGYRCLSSLLAFTLLSLLAACTSPTQKLLKTQGWQGETIAIDQFQLWIARNQKARNQIVRNQAPKTTRALHIYFSGDGSPWLNNRLIALDPTPQNPVALRLMSLDPNPALYLGRPCYHLAPGKSQLSPCSHSLWTFKRYSQEVVDVMSKAVQQLSRGWQNITLIGFSGGGVLATLVAERSPEVKTVVSIAANLDIQLWTDTMSYSPLSGSINPNKLGRLRSDLQRIHLIGLRDTQVPPPVTRAFSDNHGGKVLVFSDFNHHCCWHNIWPELIANEL